MTTPTGKGLPARVLRRLRVRSQRLHTAASHDDAGSAAVVRGVTALQAQDARAAALGVRARSGGLMADDVVRAQVDERSIVRAWCMRGTLHLVPADQLRQLLAIFGPVFIRRARRRMAQLGLDDATVRGALPRIRVLLGETAPSTRHDIADALAAQGVPIDRDGQAPVHLVRRACLAGIAVETGTRDDEPVYGLLDQWLPGEPDTDRAAALAALARRYLSAHQPAGRDDFAAWSGLPVADVRAGWRAVADEAAPVDADRRLWCLADARDATDDGGTPSVRLLPAFDGYLLGYARRTHAVAPQHAQAVHPGGGIIRPTVLRDGTCVATWRIDRSRRLGRVIIRPFVALSDHVTAALDAEVADVGRFLGHRLVLDIEPS